MNVYGASDDVAREGWCTPKWLADIINLWRPAIDPCSNPRGHITAHWLVGLPHDGLAIDHNDMFGTRPRMFINPPYCRGSVIRWVKRWIASNFIFLLKWAPDTEWFAELWPHCWGAWHPWQRINFEPPPGVKSSSNPMPHALYFADMPGPGEFREALLAHGYFTVRLK